MRRHIIGVLGIAGLAFAAYFYFADGYDGLNSAMPSMALRLGIVMSAIWVGIPDLDRLFSKYPPWVFAVSIAALILIVRSPRTLPFVIGLLVLGIAFQFFTRFVAPPKKLATPPKKKKKRSRP